MKKKLSLILSMILCFSSLCTAMAQEQTTEDTVVEEVIAISEEEYWDGLNLSAKVAFELGIIERNYDDMLDLDTVVSRAELIQLICAVLHYGDKIEGASAMADAFVDVGQYHYAANEIGWMKSAGLISGYDDGTFRPENNSTVEEAVIMLMNAAGYSNVAKFSTSEKISLAQKKNLFKYLDVNLQASLTREIAATLLGNFVFLNTASLNGDIVNYNGETILEKYMDFDVESGILEASNGVSLYGDSVSKVSVIIDKNEYNIINDKNYEDLLGYNVIGFYNSDNEIEVIIPSKNNVLKIESNDIIDFENSRYYYYVDEKEKSVYVNLDRDILLNGEYTSDITQMKPECGYVVLVDNDDNGKYDVVKIENYLTYMVEITDSATNSVVMKNKDLSNQQIVYNLDDWDEYVVVNKNGEVLNINALKENAVVNVAEGTTKIKFYVSTETLEGTVNRLSTNDNNVMINKIEYPMIDAPYFGSWNGSLGITLTAHFDCFGNVAAFSGVKSGEWRFGFIVKYGIDEETDLMFIKFLDQDGEFKRLLCSEKVYIDSDRKRDSQSAKTALEAAYNNFPETAPGVQINTVEDKKYYERISTRLMRYCVNNQGEIKNIDTPVMKSMFTTPNTVINTSDCLLITAKGRLHKSDTFASMLRAPYGTGNCEVLGEVLIDSKSFVFSVPFDLADLVNEELYSVSNSLTGLSNDGYFASSGYTITDGSLTSDVVVISKQIGETSSDTDVAMFDKITYELNKYDEPVDIIHGIFNGTQTSYTISSKNTFNVSGLQQGDVILYSLDNGEVIVESIAYRGSNHTGILATTNKYLTRPGEQHYFAKGRLILAKVERKDDTVVVLNYDTSQEMMPSIGDLFMYDYSDEIFLKVSTDNIRTTSVYNNDADYIIVHQVAGQIVDKFLIRK